MTATTIIGYEKNISAIFSDDFAFEVPLYQRPYAWTTENAEELLIDLDTYAGASDITQSDAPVDRLDPYFLGSIVLIKDQTTPISQVVDGQQRLTTLTILLSVLRHLSDEGDKAKLGSFIFEEENKYKGTSDRPRLLLRERDREFFQTYIQKNGNGIEGLKSLDSKQLATESQRNIRNNALHLLSLIEAKSPQQRQRLAEYLLQRCYLVVVTTPEPATAYRVFSVLNQRGLDLSPTDILKADIIGEIEGPKQEEYTKRWEDIEQALTRPAFADLFAHIRMIHRKVKAQGTTLEEIRRYIKPEKDPVRFIENTLEPLSDAFLVIRNKDHVATHRADEVNRLFRFLNQIDNFDWVPPAILYLSRHKAEPDSLVRFFTELERLAACMMIMRTNINNRIQRYGLMLTSIEDGKELFASDSPLSLTPEECARALENLKGDIYHELYARYVLLRLDSSLKTGEAIYNQPIISIEHVLPQSPQPGSQWLTWFPDEDDRQIKTHQLGNLVLLSRRKNSQSQNFDFEKKKEQYFSKEAAPFALTAQVQKEEVWTPEVIERRQQQLVDVLANEWRLQ